MCLQKALPSARNASDWDEGRLRMDMEKEVKKTEPHAGSEKKRRPFTRRLVQL